MPDCSIGAGQRQRRVARHRAFLHEQFTHGHHFPVDLVALGAAIVVEAGFGVGVDLPDGERAALDPGIAQVGHVGRPVVPECRLHPRRGAVEAGGDVLLAVGHKIGLRVLRVDGDMDAEAETCGLRDVLDHLHLRAVEADAVDVGAGRRIGGCRGDAIDQRVLAALRRVYEFESLIGIGAREGAKMVADRAVVTVGPVPDRSQHPVGIEIERIGAAAELGRQQRDPVAEAASLDVGPAVDDLADDMLLLGASTNRLEDAVVRRAAQRVVAEHGGFGDARGADGDVQHGAPAHPGLARRCRGRRSLGLARRLFMLGDEVGLEFRAVLFQHFGVALEEFVDRSLTGRKVRRRAIGDDRGDQRNVRSGCLAGCFPNRLNHASHSLVVVRRIYYSLHFTAVRLN